MNTERITAHWMATVSKGPSVMVESTLGSGSVLRDGVINKARAMRIILDGVKAAQMGNVVKITIDIQPARISLHNTTDQPR